MHVIWLSHCNLHFISWVKQKHKLQYKEWYNNITFLMGMMKIYNFLQSLLYDFQFSINEWTDTNRTHCCTQLQIWDFFGMFSELLTMCSSLLLVCLFLASQLLIVNWNSYRSDCKEILYFHHSHKKCNPPHWYPSPPLLCFTPSCKWKMMSHDEQNELKIFPLRGEKLHFLHI